ncbi:MAG: RidA family protein [Algisphaera sp.]
MSVHSINIKSALEKLGLVLPPPPQPAAHYAPSVQRHWTLYVSGQLPMQDGELLAQGLVGRDVDLAMATACARQCMLNALAVVNQAVGGNFAGKRFVGFAQVTVYVASAPGFVDQHLVADGATQLLSDLGFSPSARAAVGVTALPLNAPMEIALVAALHNEDREQD